MTPNPFKASLLQNNHWQDLYIQDWDKFLAVRYLGIIVSFMSFAVKYGCNVIIVSSTPHFTWIEIADSFDTH